MKIKTSLPLLILSAAALASCSGASFITGSNGNASEEVMTPEDGNGLYVKALDNAESIENEEPVNSEEESAEESPEESQEESIEESGEESAEESTEEESSEEEESFSVKSYHVGFTSTFAFKASISDYVLADESEVDTYTLDYENDEEAGSLFHVSGDTVISSFGETEDQGGMDAFYQNGYFYTTQSYGEQEIKIAYSISSRLARQQFSDYFVSIKDIAMLDDSSDEANEALVASLLESEDVKIVSDEGGILTIAFDYEEGSVEVSIDKEHRLFTHVSVDFSSYGDELKEHFADTDLSIDEFTYKLEADVSYNDVDLTPMSEEEIAEYAVYHGYDYSHHEGHDYGHHGHHDDHDEDIWSHDDWGQGHEESEEETSEEESWGDEDDPWEGWDTWGEDWSDWGDDSGEEGSEDSEEGSESSEEGHHGPRW